jgi:hypothetical protein
VWLNDLNVLTSNNPSWGLSERFGEDIGSLMLCFHLHNPTNLVVKQFTDPSDANAMGSR